MDISDSLFQYSSNRVILGYERFFKQEFEEDTHGLQLFRKMFLSNNPNHFIHDRTGNITVPFRTSSIPNMDLPKFVKMTDSYSDVCDARAIELMEFATKRSKKIAVMYGGGIDSTIILVAFLRNFKPEFLRKNLIVLMNGDSIDENNNFYLDHISKYRYCIRWYCQTQQTKSFQYYLSVDLFAKWDLSDPCNL